MDKNQMDIRRFEVSAPQPPYNIQAVCVSCGEDLVVVIGGGSRYHLGAAALSICMPSIKDPHKMTNSTYQIPVPGHKEEALARESSLLLSQELCRNVVVTVGIHEDNISRENIQSYVERFNVLIDLIRQAYAPSV